MHDVKSHPSSPLTNVMKMNVTVTGKFPVMLQPSCCQCRPTGAVRVSFGWMSNLQDAQAVLTFLQTCFLGKAGDSLSCAGDSLSPADNIASDLGHKPTSCSIHQEDGVEVGASHARATDAAGSSTDATSDSESSIELESVGVAHQHLQRCQHVLPDQHLQQPQQHEQQQQRQQPNQGPFYQHTSDTAWRSSHHHQHQQPQHDQQPQHGQQPQHDQQTQHGQQVHHSLQMQTQHAQQSGHQGFESLKGLPWVSCGDAVRALTAAELQTQRQNPNSQASTSAATGKAGLVIDGSIPEPAQGSLQGIWVYPIKSCAGVSLQSVQN